MIGTLFTLTKKSDQTKTITINDRSTNPTKFLALQQYPSFELDVRNDEINREGQHGIWDFFSFYGKRVITFEGVIVGEDEEDVTEVKDQLQQVLELPAQPTTDDDGTIIITWTDPEGRELQTEAKIAAYPRFVRNMQQVFRLDFFLTLKSANPSIESQEVFEENGIRGYPTAGFTIPFSLPVMLASTNVNVFEVENVGNTVADITVRLYGSMHMTINSPTITNLTTGVTMKINVALADETEYVEINTRTGAIVDQDGADLSGSLEAGGGYPRLNTGVNELFYTSDESVGASSPPATRVDPDEIVETEHRFAIL